MDAKALAKSKRAHSQHHSKKFYSNQKPKAPSDGKKEAGSAKKPPGNQNLQSKSSKPKLPSNWDRYGEEIHSDSEELNGAETPVPDAILPKSKGADYRYLIAEAQSQTQSFTCMDFFPSLDDVFPREVSCGGSAMAAVMGEGILSWARDDSFIVDDKTTPNPEASFLSLNLHTLAEQLGKIDLAKRLFIEEDILPPELRAKRKVVCDEQFSQIEAFDFQEGIRNIETPTAEFCEKGDTGDSVRDSKADTSGTFGRIHRDPTVNLPPAISSNEVEKVDPIVLRASSEIKSPKHADQLNTMFTIENKKASPFESAAAEAELDMLLNSFSETVDVNVSAIANTPNIDDVLKTSPHLPRISPYLASKSTIAADLDDSLDDLLQETSHLISHKEKPVHDHIEQSPLPHSGINSIANDDFDSWLDTI